jgi:hypothetical protein
MTTLPKITEQLLDTILTPTYPPDHFDRISGANTLWLSGLSMRRIISKDDFRYQGAVRAVLERGGIVQIVMLDPESEACRYAAIQDFGKDRANRDEYRTRVLETLTKLCDIKAERKGTLSIATVDYMPTFGLDIVDPEEENAIIYVRYYPLNSEAVGDDKPYLRLEKSYGRWYQFYYDQFKSHLMMAENWNCTGSA